MRAGAVLLLLLLLSSCTASGGPSPTLPAEQQARISASAVPVLLPRRLDLSATTLVVEPAYTATHVPAPGLTISLHASRNARAYPGIAPAPGTRRLRGGSGHVTRNEGIWTASWIEDGVAFALDLECADGTDPRCADERHLLELVEALAEVAP